jgi:hypothetical protein
MVGHEPVVVVIGVHGPGERELLEVADADGGAGAFLGPRQRGQEQAGKDRDDRDDDQQLDEGEGWRRFCLAVHHAYS